MKKICVLFVLFIMLLSTFSYKLAFKDFGENNGVYTFYTVGECCELDNVKVIKNGNSNVIRVDINYAREVRTKINNILGESVSFKGDLLRFSNIKDYFQAKYIIDETVETNLIVFSGFSEKLQNDLKTINIDNKEINFQIAYNKGTITIGTPVILGDY